MDQSMSEPPAACAGNRALPPRPFLAAAVLVALALLAYLPAMRGGFFWDDDRFLYANNLIRARDGLRCFWLTTDATDYFPLTSSMLWVEWRLWGNHPAGYHVINVLLHAACALLLWRVLRRLAVPGAWLAGVLFAVHPVAAASVAWITELKNTLSLIFCAASLLVFLSFDERAGPTFPRFQLFKYLLSLALFLLALLSKTSVVMLPVVLLLCAWWRRGTVARKDLLRTVPFFALSLALGIVTVWFQQQHAIHGVTVRPESLASRVAASGWIAWFYFFKVLLPAGLCIIYPRWAVPGSRPLAFLPLALLVAGMTLFWARRNSWGRAPLFALAYFLIMLLPVLGFVDMSFMEYSLAADHLQYAAMIGLIAFAAGILGGPAARGWEFYIRRQAIAPPRPGQGARLDHIAPELRGRIGAVAAAGCVVVLGILTWNRASLYGDDQSLWRDNVNKNPSAWLAWNNLGWTYYREGLDEKAVRFFHKAIELNPKFDLAYNNCAGALARMGRYAEALDDCNMAIQWKPDWASAYNTRGNINQEMGRFAEAVADYDKAVGYKPDFADAYGNRAHAHYRMKEYEKALADVKMCLKLGGRLDPDFLKGLYEAAGRRE